MNIRLSYLVLFLLVVLVLAFIRDYHNYDPGNNGVTVLKEDKTSQLLEIKPADTQPQKETPADSESATIEGYGVYVSPE